MADKSTLKKIGRKFGMEFVEMPVPTDEDVQGRIAERLTVLLEDRFRKLSPAKRKVVDRFSPLVASLAGSEDERALLAMLLEELYYATFHAPENAVPQPEAPLAAATPTEGQQQGKSSKKRSKRKKGKGQGKSDT